ncbi:LuxR C-terminal-related transcriptional regulator [Paenibacillus sp. LHD-38]|uniref:response regulator transcription factor n=1 Tax=Paenibacillus sp. LHD-38 TaxID=3072143 RepID=UPI00280D054D|nr:LuxR C-terminal-related transcriptional regulator [Paenibacillus sp. LHD-38]MDQ8736425.1 LuxR C-terminal-related transcriptional regulator [Paenibacillus sp. LHD-38]
MTSGSPLFIIAIQFYAGEEDEMSHNFTNRELDVLKCLREGYNNVEISNHLFISVSTVKTHIHYILQKLDISDFDSLVLYLCEHDEIFKKNKP